MRTSTLILSLTTATFAMSTAYLAWELHHPEQVTMAGAQGAHPAGDRSVAGLPPEGLQGEEATQSADRPGFASPAAVAAAPVSGITPATQGSGASSADGTDDPTAAFTRQLVRRLDDPSQRQVLLDEQKSSVRRQFARLKEKLKLSDARFEQLVTTVAEQNLQGQENWARCATDPACDPKDVTRMRIDDRTQELLALLGTEGFEDFNRFRDSLQERDAVAQLRGRLTDNLFLPQAQAEQLVTALADERKRYTEEASARGAHVSAWGTNLGLMMFPEDAPTIDARLAEAAQYSQRLRARAATVLSAAQLAAFNQMQDELLAQMAAYLRPPPAPQPKKAGSLKLAQN